LKVFVLELLVLLLFDSLFKSLELCFLLNLDDLALGHLLFVSQLEFFFSGLVSLEVDQILHMLVLHIVCCSFEVVLFVLEIKQGSLTQFDLLFKLKLVLSVIVVPSLESTFHIFELLLVGLELSF
jgi:hypothetical protein